MFRFAVIILLLFAVGCDDFRWSNRRRNRGWGGRRNIDNTSLGSADALEFWQPRSRIFMQSSVSQYSTALRDYDLDPKAARLALAEAGHLLQEFARPSELADSPRERHLCQCILFAQACAFAESNHADHAFHALETAEKFGFADTYRLMNSPGLHSLRSDPRLKALHQRMIPKEPAETMIAIQSAFQGLRSQPFPLQLIRKSDQTSLTTTDLANVNVLFMFGSWDPMVREFIPIAEKAGEEWKPLGARFWMVGIDVPARKKNAPTILESLSAETHDLEVLSGERRMFSELREIADFPSTILLDKNSRIIAMLNGYHSIETLRGVLQLATQGSQRAPSY